MRNKIKLIYLVFILSLPKIDGFSQYYIDFKGDSTAFEIDSAVGIYSIPSGIKIILPQCVVIENALLSFDLLDKAKSDPIIPFGTVPGKIFCTGPSCIPTGTKFYKPIKINIHVETNIPSDLYHVYLHNLPTQSWEKYLCTILCLENEKYAEIDQNCKSEIRYHINRMPQLIDFKPNLFNQWIIF